MKRILIILAAVSFVFFASCSNSGPASLRLHNATGTEVTNVLIGGNAVGTVAAGGYSASFEFEADSRVNYSWNLDAGGSLTGWHLVDSGEWDLRWNGTSTDLVER